MTDQAIVNTCDHHYEHQIRGGEPLTVSVCQFCRMPDWADLREQVAGIRDAARQAAGQPDTKAEPGDCTCGSVGPPFVHYRDCPQYNAPAVGQPAGPADLTLHSAEFEAREPIENLWDRATPVGPLLDAYRAAILHGAAREADRAGGMYAANGDHDRAGAAFALMETYQRLAAGAES